MVLQVCICCCGLIAAPYFSEPNVLEEALHQHFSSPAFEILQHLRELTAVKWHCEGLLAQPVASVYFSRTKPKHLHLGNQMKSSVWMFGLGFSALLLMCVLQVQLRCLLRLLLLQIMRGRESRQLAQCFWSVLNGCLRIRSIVHQSA